MLKIAILIGFSLSAQAYKPRKCPQDFIWTDKGCIRDCKSQRFSDCPQFFTLQFKPNFCALNQDGSWNQYTFECQACSSPGNIGVTRGSCGTIKDRQLGDNKQKDNKLKTIKCPIYRPTEEVCPTNQYFVAPELNFCGVTYDGMKQGYDLACSACKDKRIEYYYKSPCDKIGLSASQLPASLPNAPVQATSTSTVPLVQQYPPQHEDNICLDDTCCQQYEFCLNKKCTDKCAMMRCAGGCERGSCQNIQRN